MEATKEEVKVVTFESHNEEVESALKKCDAHHQIGCVENTDQYNRQYELYPKDIEVGLEIQRLKYVSTAKKLSELAGVELKYVALHMIVEQRETGWGRKKRLEDYCMRANILMAVNGEKENLDLLVKLIKAYRL